MTPATTRQGMERMLVVHPDAVTRQLVEQALRRINAGSLAVYHAAHPTEGAAKARQTDAQVIFLALDEETDLALAVARTLRQTGRLVLGLYNPVLERDAQAELLRRATRAGVADFVTLPVSDTDLAAALDELVPPTATEHGASDGFTIAFHSNKGGVGTTTLAVNVAVAMASQTDRNTDPVLLFDADMQAGCVAEMLGLAPDRDAADMAADLDDLGPIGAYLLRHEPSGLLVLASPRDLARAETITPELAARLLIALRARCRRVLVDAASRLDALSLGLLDLSDIVCLITEPVAPTLQRTAQLLQLLEEQGFSRQRLKLILRRMEPSDSELVDEAILARLGRTADWEVPYERRALESLNRGEPLVLARPRSDFSAAIHAMIRAFPAVRPAR